MVRTRFFGAMTLGMVLGAVLVCSAGGVVLAQEPDAAPPVAEAVVEPGAPAQEPAPLGGLGGSEGPGVANVAAPEEAPIMEPDDTRQAMILTLVQDVCSTCHGVDLAGSKGPALTPESLKDKDLAVLAATILDGKLGTIMPSFAAVLSRDEARWLAQQLQKGLKNP